MTTRMIFLNKLLLLTTIFSCFLMGQQNGAGGVNAEVTEICMNETQVVQNQSSVQQELQMALQHVKGHAYDCNYTSITAFKCMIEYQGDNKTLKMYENFCDRAGGKVIHRRIDIDKNALGFLTFAVSFVGIPQCVGKSCPDGELSDEDEEKLPNNVYQNFIDEMSVGDICTAGQDPWGELDFWSGFGVKMAKWAGVDLEDCFSKPGDNSTEDNSRRERHGRGRRGLLRGLVGAGHRNLVPV